MTKSRYTVSSILVALFAGSVASAALADSRAIPVPASAALTYADLADLADSAPMVIRAQPRKIVPVEAARAPGLKAGWGRFYVEARTEGVIAGKSALGEQIRYLVDLPLDARGKVAPFKKKSVVLFARTVPARPGELQLVAPDAQLLWNEALDGRLRGILGELYAAGAPGRITGVREAIHVSGTMAGQGETQLFLNSANGEPAAITVNREPGAAPRWTVSFSEVVAGNAAPSRDTLAWYRLACFLPGELPGRANIATAAPDRAAAAQDYAFVLQKLGPCQRTRK